MNDIKVSALSVGIPTAEKEGGERVNPVSVGVGMSIDATTATTSTTGVVKTKKSDEKMDSTIEKKKAMIDEDTKRLNQLKTNQLHVLNPLSSRLGRDHHDEIMNHDGIMELPPAPPAPVSYGGDRVPSASFPGAFAQGANQDTSGGFNSATFSDQQSDDRNDGLENPATAPHPHSHSVVPPLLLRGSDTGLAVANLVDEENDPLDLNNMPHAVEEDMSNLAGDGGGGGDSSNREKTTNGGNLKTMILLGIVVVLIIVLIFVAIFVPQIKNKKNTTTNDASTQSSSLLPPTDNPTQAPTTLEEYLISLLPEGTLESIEQDDLSAPVAKAYQWLLEDAMHNPFLSEHRTVQRFALAALYYSTTGDQWSSNKDWLDHDVHECDWYTKPEFALNTTMSFLYPGYLSSFFPTEEGPRTCNVQGFYQHLWLDENNLQGSLPQELYLLTNLRTVSFGLNLGLQGSISSHIGQLTALQGLGLAFQQNGGQIPTQIGLLNGLRALILHFNNHQGSIPAQIWHQLTNLEFLIVSRNRQLEGTIPSEIAELTKLKWIIMNESNFTGTIPTEIGQMTSLEYLDLIDSQLKGPVPSQLGLLTNMGFLALRNNLLTGTLPTQLGAMTSMTLLSFGNSKLSGSLPSEIGLMTKLRIILNGQASGLTGMIPSEIGQLSLLQDLALENNNLSQMIPSQLGQLTSLGFLGLANNSLLSGTIPQELEALQTSLYGLHLQGLQLLQGTIPLGLCKINATCQEIATNACDEDGLKFDCSNNSLLCGCDCPCADL